MMAAILSPVVFQDDAGDAPGQDGLTHTGGDGLFFGDRGDHNLEPPAVSVQDGDDSAALPVRGPDIAGRGIHLPGVAGVCR